MLDLIGKVFSKLTVLKDAGRNKRNEVLWLCKCECGNEHVAKTYNLTHGLTQSCGCIKTGIKREELKGLKFHYLTVGNYAGRDKWRDSLYECHCKCGKTTIVPANALKAGLSKSCGCWNVEVRKACVGSLNSNWNPDLTDEERVIRRNTEDYRKWRIGVYQRDKWTCQCCLKRKDKNDKYKKIVAHHIESYKFNKDLRTDINNGICLCSSCHLSFHKKYGWGNSNKKNFVEFMIWKQKKLGV